MENNNNKTNIDVLLQARNRRTIIFIIATFAIVCFIGSFYSISNKGEYIDGNVLKLALSTGVQSEVQSVGNPWKNSSYSGQMLFRNLFSTDSTLTKINPDLCSNYEILNDGMTYVITLNDNIKWSDGTDLTMDDVVFSIEAFMKCIDVNPIISTAFNAIEGVDDYVAGKTEKISGLVQNGNQLTINLKNRYNSFLLMLTQFPPLPKHILQDTDYKTLTSNHSFFNNGNSISNGMYMSIGLNEDYNLVYIKNPYYEGNSPEIEKVVFYWDYSSVDVDLLHTTDIAEIVNYRSMSEYEEHLVDVYFYRYFVFNLAGGNGEPNEAMQDVRVRQAINHAIDIEDLLHDIYYDAGSLIYGGSTDFANEVYEYNPEKAKELLIEAGYDFDRPFVIIYYYTDAISYIFLERVTRYLYDVGLSVELVKSSDNADLYENCEYDMMLKGLSSFNTKDWYYEFLSTNTTLTKLLGTSEFDSLVEQFNAVSDTDEYDVVLKELVELEQSLVYKIPLFTLNQAVYVNTNRLQVPKDIVFGNTRYSNNLRLDEWEIKRN